ncbi:hypothetical protein O181_017396 [Austropuccinia psidii MF-1]|uniref:Integrase catalytic domain-containing protein n=1 Tax=Austropuccinia psidii MF-1 TaxID=1389203 RepID=A0A9Q3C7I1_9BASI|nr:hypothetical protein [Austropuccinia psidii MF-1]
MIKIQEPSRPGGIVNMDWVTVLPPGVNRSYNSYLVIFDRFSKTPIFFSCHKYDTSLLILNKVGSFTCILANIFSDRDPKFTPALWRNFHQLFGTKLSFSTAYHPKTDGLAERIIQTLEDMFR